MRKIITLILDYFLVLIVGTILGLFIYVQYFNSLSLVAGRTFKLSTDMIFHALFQTLPVIFMLLSFALFLYKIRHRSKPAGSFITYLILSLSSWFLFYPLTLIFQNKMAITMVPVEMLKEQQPLSSGYFRHSDGKLYYFIEDAKEGNAKTMQIYDEKNPAGFADEKLLDVADDSDFDKANEPFHDPLISEAMQDNPFQVIKMFYSIKNQARDAWNNGFFAWGCFASFGLALCSIYAFLRFSTWRMINAFLGMIITVVIIWFNYFYFTPGMDNFRAFMYSLFYDTGKFGFFTQRNIDFPLTLINWLISLIMATTGIVISVLRKQEEK